MMRGAFPDLKVETVGIVMTQLGVVPEMG